MRLALVLAVLLAACTPCTPLPRPADGVAYVYSGGRWSIAGHDHVDTARRIGCEGCTRDAVDVSLSVVQRAAGPPFDQLARRVAALEARHAPPRED